MSLPAPLGAPAGWYPDPSGQPALRYYDGYRWTAALARIAPPPPPPPPPVPEHPTLPFSVVVGAVAILAGSLVGSRVLLDALVQRHWPVPALMAISVVVGYGPSVGWLGFVSHRWGSGHPLSDLGVRVRWSDLGWGPLVWLCTLLSMGVTLAAVRAIGIPYRGNLDLDGHLLGHGAGLVADVNRTAVVSLVVSAVVCAPVVEEAVFRGAVLRGLLSKMPTPGAIVLQGLMFGGAHFNPDFGRDSIGLIVVLSVTGIAFGVAAYLLRRIGPTIIAHAILNGVAIAVALAGLG